MKVSYSGVTHVEASEIGSNPRDGLESMQRRCQGSGVVVIVVAVVVVVVVVVVAVVVVVVD